VRPMMSPARALWLNPVCVSISSGRVCRCKPVLCIPPIKDRIFQVPVVSPHGDMQDTASARRIRGHAGWKPRARPGAAEPREGVPGR